MRAHPLGRTETSDYWVGYMDGAVRSGERAAAEVLAELSSVPWPTHSYRCRLGARKVSFCVDIALT